MHLRTGDATLNVVETNQFKHLSHLSLVFRQGNDTVIKQFLAGRLAEYKVNGENAPKCCTVGMSIIASKVYSVNSSEVTTYYCKWSVSLYHLSMVRFTVAGQAINGDMHEKLRRTLHSLEKALRDSNSLSK